MVLKLPSRTHLGAERFKTLGWLKVADRKAMLRFRLGQGILINSAPNHLKGYIFKRVSDAHNYNTRAKATTITTM